MVKFKDQLSSHLRFIRKSCEDFDNGELDEALRIAVSLRVIFHDTKSSTSLLSHLGAKKSIKLASTFTFVKALAEFSGRQFQIAAIYPIIMTSEGVKVPLNDWDINAWHSVSEWWNEVIWAEDGETYARSDVILSAANQDGGAHVDANPNYKTLKFREGPRVSIKVNGRTLPNVMENHHYSLIRQMAYEIQASKDILELAKNT